jgi:hypothetical protein
MATKKVNVISWAEALDLLPKSNKSYNKELLNILTEISQELKKDSNDYVYHLKLQFGDKIIDKGKIAIETPEITQNSYNKNKEDFLSDIHYSNDPLGIVLTNHLEVFTENKSNGGSNGNFYTVPLNILKPANLFGVFGVLDYFSGIKNESFSRDWYVRAGNVSFSIAFPFHNGDVRDSLEYNYYEKASNGDDKGELSPGDYKVRFIKNLVEDWFVDIAYFPKHFFEKIPDDLKLRLKMAIYETGWTQSADLRKNLFEDTTVFNLISNPLFKLKHEKNFINILFGYLKNTLNGNKYIMKPLLGNHVINTALDRFKERNINYFGTNKYKEPLPFIYCNSNNGFDWGVVSAYHFPIIYNYEILSLINLLKDLDRVNKRIDGDINISNDYKIPAFKGFGNTGGKGATRISNMNEIRKIMSEKFGCNEERINLNSKEFSNLILIKKNAN